MISNRGPIPVPSQQRTRVDRAGAGQTRDPTPNRGGGTLGSGRGSTGSTGRDPGTRQRRVLWGRGTPIPTATMRRLDTPELVGPALRVEDVRVVSTRTWSRSARVSTKARPIR